MLFRSSSENYEREISLFRPMLELLDVPPEVRVRSTLASRFAKLDEKIRIRNTGEGTAIIQVELKSKDEFEKLTAVEFDDFRKRFIDDVEMKLRAISAEDPSRADLIVKFLSLLKTPIVFNEEGKRKSSRSSRIW